MLEELYGHMSGLQSFEKETLLDEEPEIMQRRAAVKQVTTFSLMQSWMLSCMPRCAYYHTYGSNSLIPLMHGGQVFDGFV